MTGQELTITNTDNGKKATAKVADLCPSCVQTGGDGSLDLVRVLPFSLLANTDLKFKDPLSFLRTHRRQHGPRYLPGLVVLQQLSAGRFLFPSLASRYTACSIIYGWALIGPLSLSRRFNENT